jgi:hypothetical protein
VFSVATTLVITWARRAGLVRSVKAEVRQALKIGMNSPESARTAPMPKRVNGNGSSQSGAIAPITATPPRTVSGKRPVNQTARMLPPARPRPLAATRVP